MHPQFPQLVNYTRARRMRHMVVRQLEEEESLLCLLWEGSRLFEVVLYYYSAFYHQRRTTTTTTTTRKSKAIFTRRQRPRQERRLGDMVPRPGGHRAETKCELDFLSGFSSYTVMSARVQATVYTTTKTGLVTRR